MKVAIASDHGGMNIRKEMISLMKEMNIEYVDLGCECSSSVDYPDYAIPVAEKVANGEVDRGILICGTGIGMSIAANKVKGIRCALVHDTFSAKATREHNDTNILSMGERVIGPGLARDIARIWLTTPFEGGRHEHRVNKISIYEAEKITFTTIGSRMGVRESINRW
ncbi:ribose 5-phosphate isomerase B [Bacillus sp. ISL-40]|uniref:ribose 5-phosphate isomerase B n=1 Tax=unclassified Bacillus (in: firmicutes) TaxID=185979 RepID=UPI001BE6D16F|nr:MULTISPECIES: ribose 5-phosphate isomerase B [unclassified Bacillus (in: firmicutes)]MBT2696604.1 ribose 5-phosphate isomerase B [Bacillus sp. ISL-40]MBT2740814.1 ribose 5-phosphate isomerase B [Bacillus sp. ISL-77]